MTTRITVDVPDVPLGLLTRDPAVVMAIVSQEPRVRRSQDDSIMIAGRTIIGAYWTDTELRIGLDGGRHIRFFTDDPAVDWQVGDSECGRGPGNAQRIGAPPVWLHMPPQKERVWDRSGMIAKRMGKRVTMMMANVYSVWLYVEGTPILQFSCLWQLPGKAPLLYWHETV